MAARFHRRVQIDLNGILEKYYAISDQLGDDFFAEFQIGVEKACSNPRFFHFDSSGLRRCNLDSHIISYTTFEANHFEFGLCDTISGTPISDFDVSHVNNKANKTVEATPLRSVPHLRR